MAATPVPLRFETNFEPETGRLVTLAPNLARVTAPNTGPYTFAGTNTFLVGTASVAVIDPGPDDARHFAALLAAIAHRPVEAILLTHTHKDHCALAARLKAATGAPLWFEGRHRLSRKPRLFEMNAVARASDWSLAPDRTLRDGETLSAGGVALKVVATPGHCANHLALGFDGTPFVLCGDHVMGWSSTLVSAPDGSMADYLASLDKLIAAPFSHYLPAHGGGIADGRTYATALKAHRAMRNAQIVAAVGAGARSIGDLLKRIYPDLKPMLLPAARMTLKAHVEYLGDRGEIAVSRRPTGTRLAPVQAGNAG